MQGIILSAIVLVIALSVIMGIFLLLRSIERYRLWQDGEKDERWLFLAYLIGGIALVLLGFNLTGAILDQALNGIMVQVCLVIGLGSMALATVYYIFQWLHSD